MTLRERFLRWVIPTFRMRFDWGDDPLPEREKPPCLWCRGKGTVWGGNAYSFNERPCPKCRS